MSRPSPTPIEFHSAARRRAWAVLACVVLFGCGDDDAQSGRAALDHARGEALEAGATAAGVDATLRWREAAREAGLELDRLRAERHLEGLAAQPAVACVVTVARARLAASEDPRASYLAAYRATESAPDDAACRERARRLLDELAAHRPPAAELASRGSIAGCRVARVAVLGSGVITAEALGTRVLLFPEGDCLLEGHAQGGLFVVSGPGLVVDSAVPEELPVGAGGVVALRRRDDAVVLELAEGASAQAFDLGSRFVIDVAAHTTLDERAEGAARLVVIDPGHGGMDFGARFDGLKEAQVALDLAERAARIVARRLPSSRVVLTRTRDEIVGLEQRAAFANAVGADLFVSIHLNAADEPVRVGGVTTFVLDVTDDRQALRLAARENETGVAEVTGIQRLLARVHRADQVERSRRLAEHVHEATLAGGRRVLPELPDRGVKSAMFYVLVGARMPAILLEASFLTKPEEAAALHTEAYREALAAGIAEGIVRYVAELDAR
ncbi:MAG: N-acetylmuramoyl-L-alanine amidase [Sandaracinus sp.]|nr:N-acetylmuramoyl-L-alanine amidase [Sandaracinus sp.]MCB9611382.1 N-acetylmuramoyl-L-alanine amidase [Sandaracinus sp.]MCB9632279.1 N-acetylmuramoyl-L-alanine amidase [Sandaracinus sp.]